MRWRILASIVGVTIVATIVLTVPLALLVANREHADARTELDRVAERTATEITSDSSFGQGPIEIPTVEKNITVGVYLPSGKRVAGSGPDQADAVTASSELLTIDGLDGKDRVLARPIVERERQVAVIRVAEPQSEAELTILRDIGVLLAFDAAAVIVAAGVGAFVASRLVRPLRAIRDDAVRLGDGDFSIDPARSGIPELDETADALAETARRLDRVMQRERAFTADASHQLRTPLTSLRLAIEGEIEVPGSDPELAFAAALLEIDRLETTISTLLDVARDRPISRDLLDIQSLASALTHRWQEPLGRTNRRLTFEVRCNTEARVSRHVLDQILDILIDNALVHGAGDVQLLVAEEGGNLAVTVGDEGRLARDPAELFIRRDPGAAGHGLGLALARSLAEAEGGRLIVSTIEPTAFRVLLPDSRKRFLGCT